MKKTLNAIVGFVFLAPAIYLTLIWNSLPSKVPMQYNMEGTPSRYGSPSELLIMVLILTVVNIGVYLLLLNVHKLDPKKYAIENRDRMQRIAFVISVFISLVVSMIIYAISNAAHSINVFSGIILSAVGLLFSFTGNYMYSMKPNYFAGFRIPWTLENEDNWKKTHHLGGKLWFFGGIIIAITCLLLPFKTGMIVFLCATAVLVLIPLIYSYRLYKKQRIGS